MSNLIIESSALLMCLFSMLLVAYALGYNAAAKKRDCQMDKITESLKGRK